MKPCRECQGKGYIDEPWRTAQIGVGSVRTFIGGWQRLCPECFGAKRVPA